MRPGSLVPVPAKEVVALGAVGAVPPGVGVVDGFRAKDHTLLRVNGRDVTFSLGTTFFLGSSGTGAPDAAPDTHAAHHMPAHIFIQFDRWGDASRTGERAVALALEWVTRRGVALSEVGDHTYGHLMDYLQYALLQEGRFDDAKALVEQARSDYDESGKAASLRVKLASTSARYLVETGQWDEAATLAETARSEAKNSGRRRPCCWRSASARPGPAPSAWPQSRRPASRRRGHRPVSWRRRCLR